MGPPQFAVRSKTVEMWERHSFYDYLRKIKYYEKDFNNRCYGNVVRCLYQFLQCWCPRRYKEAPGEREHERTLAFDLLQLCKQGSVIMNI